MRAPPRRHVSRKLYAYMSGGTKAAAAGAALGERVRNSSEGQSGRGGRGATVRGERVGNTAEESSLCFPVGLPAAAESRSCTAATEYWRNLNCVLMTYLLLGAKDSPFQLFPLQ